MSIFIKINRSVQCETQYWLDQSIFPQLKNFLALFSTFLEFAGNSLSKMDQESKMNQEIKPIAFKQSAKYQYLAAIVGLYKSFTKLKWKFVINSIENNAVNLLTVGCGCTGGWPSPNILILESDATPLATGKITMEECSWIASLWCIGGLIGNPIFCFITNNYGRKMPLVFLAIPAIVSFILFFSHFKIWGEMWLRPQQLKIEISEINQFFSFISLDQLAAHFIRSKCLLFVCRPIDVRDCGKWRVHNRSAIFVGNCQWSVGKS